MSASPTGPFPTTDSTLGAIAQELQGFGGFLRCRTCRETRQLGSVGMKLKNGWPKCCGYTMEWITRRQVREGYLDDPEAWTAKEKGQPTICGFCSLGRLYAGTDRETDCPYCDGTGEMQEVGR